MELKIVVERIDIHYHGATQDELRHINERLAAMSLTQAEQTAQLQAISDGLSTLSDTLTTSGAQLTKALGEIQTEITTLQAAAGGNSTPAMDALFTSIQGKLTAASTAAATVTTTAQTLDDLNPDTPTPTPTAP